MITIWICPWCLREVHRSHHRHDYLEVLADQIDRAVNRSHVSTEFKARTEAITDVVRKMHTELVEDAIWSHMSRFHRFRSWYWRATGDLPPMRRHMRRL